MQLAINQDLGGNVIKRQIGEDGASGIAYEAENSKYTSAIVLKLFNKVGDAKEEKRFFQENKILRKLAPHKRIINPLSDVYVNGTYIYYLMDKADYSLHKFHTDNKKLPLEEIKNIMIGVCEGIAYVHSQGVAHRDLYWNNILMKDGVPLKEIMLTDFGRAKDFNLQVISDIPARIWGCFVIKPPEIEFRIWDNPSIDNYKIGDIYALGIILFYLFDWFPLSHAFRVQAEILTLLKNKSIDVLTSSEKDREGAYTEWLRSQNVSYYNNLQISNPDPDIMSKVNILIQKLCEPDCTKRYTDISKIIVDINSL